MDNKIFVEGWENRLNKQMLDPNCSKCAYICSPLNAKTDAGIIQNMISARAYMYYAWKIMEYPARAPHAYLPMLICDRIPHDRQFALEFGNSLLLTSNIMFVCGNRISEGMKQEIINAVTMRISVITFHKSVWLHSRTLVENNGTNPDLIKLNREHPLMASPNPLEYKKDGEKND